MRNVLLASILCAFVATSTSPSPAAEDKNSFGGIYPTLAQFNDESECGTGAVVPWADRLWTVSYGPHLPNGSSDKLYEIDSELNRVVRPESVGGTNANRMIHRESNQLFIGNHAIDAQRNVRTIPHKEMFGRQTAVARHLLDPENKVYFLTMEEGLYEVDVHTLQVRELCKDGNLPRKEGEDVLPGYHGKGGYTSQGRIVYANNGEQSSQAQKDPTTESGCLAQWRGEEKGWEIVRRNQFTEVTTQGGIYGAESENDVLWSLGWDYRSVILAVLEKGEWSFFRLPKASHCYDGAHGWNTEWPRIREIDDPQKFLATMHGQFWRFPRDFSASNARGIRPRSTYLKVVGDFAYWNGRVVFGCDDSAKSEFLNKTPFKNKIQGPGRSNSNLWFVEPEKLDAFGPSLGRGALWLRDVVEANVPSDPYLFAGYDRRLAFLSFDGTDAPQEVEFVFETDSDGAGNWQELRRVRVSKDAGFAWVEFPKDAQGEWIRARVDAPLKSATCFFQYQNEDKRVEASPIFAGLAAPSDSARFLGARMWVRADNDRLAVVSEIVEKGAVKEERYYELTEEGRLERVPCRFEGGEQGTISRVKGFVPATEPDPETLKIDELSVLLHYAGRAFRLPIGSEDAARVRSPLVCRLDREVCTERDLFHCAGTFYELPAENAGGAPKIRPIATDGRLIVDYASYRGMLVLSGVKSEPSPNETRVVRSEDGLCALWLGAVDDLWSFGKPVGRGAVWKETQVKARVPSDPMLTTGFDKKTLELKNDSDFEVEVTLEADATCNDDWREYKRVKLPAKGSVALELPESFNAYWTRVVADKDATLSATFVFR